MRLRRYSNTASVPLAKMAALGVRNGFPSRLRQLRDDVIVNNDGETVNQDMRREAGLTGGWCTGPAQEGRSAGRC